MGRKRYTPEHIRSDNIKNSYSAIKRSRKRNYMLNIFMTVIS